MFCTFLSGGVVVNCRIGSLEIEDLPLVVKRVVNCRIGSLEKPCMHWPLPCQVNCRIGSLESMAKATIIKKFR